MRIINPHRDNNAFITEWTVSASDTVTLPLKTGYGYGFDVNWGDGSPIAKVESFNDVTATHTYTSGGVFDVTIRGQCQNFTVDDNATIDTKITGVKHWGDTDLRRINFDGCSNLIVTAIDIPNLSQVNSLISLFQGCSSITSIPNLNSWDVSFVWDMNYVFNGATLFNEDIPDWDVSKVTTMLQMFSNTNLFNGTLTNWDTSNVTSMVSMFQNALDFNQSVDHFNVSKVSDFTNMFRNADTYNQNMNSWVLKNTGTINMTAMFRDTPLFNGTLTSWETGNVTTMSRMFQNADDFNQNLNTSGAIWDVSAVTDFSYMFADTALFNGTLTSWDTASATTMESMFENADSFNQSVDHFDVNNVTTFRDMFRGTAIYNQSMNSWTLKNTGTITMQSMLRDAVAFNGNITSWETGNVNNFIETFRGATSFNQNLNTSGSIWDVSSVTSFTSMFSGATVFNGTLTGWDTASATGMSGMFGGTRAFQQDISHFDMATVTTMSFMFNNTVYNQASLNNLDVSNVQLFNNCFVASDFNQPLNLWVTGSATNMGEMFSVIQSNDANFDQDMTNWDFSGVTNLTNFFRGTNSLSTTNYSLLLASLLNQTLQPNLTNVEFNNVSYTQSAGETGTTDGTAANKLIDSTASFLTSGVAVNDIVVGAAGYAKVTAIDSDTQLSLDNDTAVSGEAYTIQTSDAAKGRYKLINDDNWQIFDGGPV